MSTRSTYEAVSDCVEGLCAHPTDDRCIQSWREVLAAEPVEGVTAIETILPDGGGVHWNADAHRAAAAVLIDFADTHAAVLSTEPLYQREDGEPVTTLALLRETAAAERAKAEAVGNL